MNPDLETQSADGRGSSSLRRVLTVTLAAHLVVAHKTTLLSPTLEMLVTAHTQRHNEASDHHVDFMKGTSDDPERRAQ